MNTQYQMKDRAVLMRLSLGMPGSKRQDKKLTADVHREHSLGDGAGKYVKELWPKEALGPFVTLDGEIGRCHKSFTICNGQFGLGIGILPAALILEYAERMREFASKRQNLIQAHFVPKYPEFIEWARKEHNGSFDASLYPAVETMLEKFYFKTEPLPVPDAVHFENTVASLLGTDVDSVNARVQDATKEAQRELLRRMIEPVKAMAAKLAEKPKEGKDSPIFRDTLVTNLKEIVDLAPKLNITGDAQLDAFVAEMKPLVAVGPQELRENASVRGYAASKAAEVLKKLEGYSF